MFQIAFCTRRPFLLYEFVTCTLFLTTGRNLISDSHMLSEKHVKRKINSRSSGFLKITKIKKKHVQFIHQTIKNFIIIGTGGSVIREGLSNQRLESGFGLIFRYILKLFSCLPWEARDVNVSAQIFVVADFGYYAKTLESMGECVADSFEPTILRLSVEVQHKILSKILVASVYVTDAKMSESSMLRLQNDMKFCLIYLLCSLPVSLKKFLSTHRSSMKKEAYYILLQAAIFARSDIQSMVLQILTEEGIIACLLEDDPQYMNNDVNDLLSQLRGNLPASRNFSIFPTPAQEKTEPEEG